MKVGCLLLGVLFLLVSEGVSLAEWDANDKRLFFGTCMLQIADGLTTQGWLEDDPENYIYDVWSWKYGTRRPSSGRMWVVKGVETGVAWFIADKLPSNCRKLFLMSVNALLIGCVTHNLRLGVSFRF